MKALSKRCAEGFGTRQALEGVRGVKPEIERFRAQIGGEVQHERVNSAQLKTLKHGYEKALEQAREKKTELGYGNSTQQRLEYDRSLQKAEQTNVTLCEGCKLRHEIDAATRVDKWSLCYMCAEELATGKIKVIDDALKKLK